MSVEKRFEIDADDGSVVAQIDAEECRVRFTTDCTEVDFYTAIEFCQQLMDTLEGLQ